MGWASCDGPGLRSSREARPGKPDKSMSRGHRTHPYLHRNQGERKTVENKNTSWVVEAEPTLLNSLSKNLSLIPLHCNSSTMAHCCARGMVGALLLPECGRAGAKRVVQLQVRCGMEDNGMRLPGRRQMGSYGSGGGGGGFSKSQPGLGQFRPPNLFGPPHADDLSREQAAKVEAILEQIRSGLGTWQERTTGITELQKMGMGSEEVYEKGYVAPSVQTSMVVAAQVYNSMVQVDCSPDALSWFDESKIDILYALRTLSAQQRKLAAEYVRDNELDVRGAQELARAIKDHERRPEGREGFTPVPGDCLAFSLHRAAGESTNEEERALVIERGLAVAVTESAKQRFSEFS